MAAPCRSVCAIFRSVSLFSKKIQIRSDVSRYMGRRFLCSENDTVDQLADKSLVKRARKKKKRTNTQIRTEVEPSLESAVKSVAASLGGNTQTIESDLMGELEKQTELAKALEQGAQPENIMDFLSLARGEEMSSRKAEQEDRRKGTDKGWGESGREKDWRRQKNEFKRPPWSRHGSHRGGFGQDVGFSKSRSVSDSEQYRGQDWKRKERDSEQYRGQDWKRKERDPEPYPDRVVKRENRREPTVLPGWSKHKTERSESDQYPERSRQREERSKPSESDQRGTDERLRVLERNESRRYELFDGTRLNIFNPDLHAEGLPEARKPSVWDKLAAKERDYLITTLPSNAWEEQIQWTKEGKLWTFPIDNEQGMESEAEVGFHEHVFLDQYTQDFPAKGPIRHFIDLVTVGLSKNPYLTVEMKRDNIDWFRNYFKNKVDVIEATLGEGAVGHLRDGTPE